MFKKAIAVGLLSVFGLFIFRILLRMDVFSHYNKHHPGVCRKINGKQYGSEDFQVTSDGLAFITAGLFLAPMGPPFVDFLNRLNVKGNILLFDFSKPKQDAVALKVKSSGKFNMATFRPHGISVLEDKTKGEHLLYVVNHPIGQPDRVEKFRYLPKTKELVHEKSFFSEKFHTTNDLEVVKEDVFYISDYLYSTGQFSSLVENLLQLPLGAVLFYDGKEMRTVLPNEHAPNGMVLSRDGRFLYVNMPHYKQLYVYSRDKSNNSLTLTQTVDLHTAADNLHLSQSGDALYTGCHPITHNIIGHFNNPEVGITPSQVLRIPLKDGLVNVKDITELFYDHGELISGSSIATVYNDLLLIGSVINNLVICETNGPLKAI